MYVYVYVYVYMYGTGYGTSMTCDDPPINKPLSNPFLARGHIIQTVSVATRGLSHEASSCVCLLCPVITFLECHTTRVGGRPDFLEKQAFERHIL